MMSILGSEEKKEQEVTTEETPKEEIKEIENYSNSETKEYINSDLSAITEMFDKANKNVIIHKMKVNVGGDEEDLSFEDLKDDIDEKLAKLSKRLDEIESGYRAVSSQKADEIASLLDEKLKEASNLNKESLESAILATKTEILSTVKENSGKSGGGFFGYLVALLIGAGATFGALNFM